jgi:hypothetical protein
MSGAAAYRFSVRTVQEWERGAKLTKRRKASVSEETSLRELPQMLKKAPPSGEG